MKNHYLKWNLKFVNDYYFEAPQIDYFDLPSIDEIIRIGYEKLARQ